MDNVQKHALIYHRHELFDLIKLNWFLSVSGHGRHDFSMFVYSITPRGG
jgi:hypothetical protein